MVGTQGNCVVWRKGFPFCHLVTGVLGFNVDGIWVEVGKWRRHAKIWWPEFPWEDSEIETYKTS